MQLVETVEWECRRIALRTFENIRWFLRKMSEDYREIVRSTTRWPSMRNVLTSSLSSACAWLRIQVLCLHSIVSRS